MMQDIDFDHHVNGSGRGAGSLVGPGVPAGAARTLAGRIHCELRRRIARGRIAPGARLVVDRLAEEFETSITPIREALRLLERDGLIEFRPHCGATVTAPTARSFTDLSEVRSALEPLAAELACGRLSAAELATLDETIAVGAACLSDDDEAAAGERWSEADHAFHALLWERSGNELLARMLGQMMDRIRLHRELYFVSRARIERSVAEHRRIVAALRTGEASTASAAMSAHMRSYVELNAAGAERSGRGADDQ